ncbi:hypothetical protein STEG23_028853 [Scotinomys teguina]
MESEYRKILLLNGLEQITEEEVRRFKFFVTDEFHIPMSKLEEATNRTELAHQLIQSVGPSSAMTKTIRLFRKLNYRNVANSLQEAKKAADERLMTNTKKKGTQQVGKRSQGENCSASKTDSATSRVKASKKQSATAVCPQAKAEKAKNMTGSSTKSQKTVTMKNTKVGHVPCGFKISLILFHPVIGGDISLLLPRVQCTLTIHFWKFYISND